MSFVLRRICISLCQCHLARMVGFQWRPQTGDRKVGHVGTFAGVICPIVHFSQARLVGESDVRSWPPTEEMMFELERQDWDGTKMIKS